MPEQHIGTTVIALLYQRLTTVMSATDFYHESSEAVHTIFAP